jgi:hypothetical protein
MTENDTRWSLTQQPVHASASSNDHLRLLAALDSGCRITDVALIHHADNADYYSVGLFHDQNRMRYSMLLIANPETSSLLRNEDVTIVYRQNETTQ